MSDLFDLPGDVGSYSDDIFDEFMSELGRLPEDQKGEYGHLNYSLILIDISLDDLSFFNENESDNLSSEKIEHVSPIPSSGTSPQSSTTLPSPDSTTLQLFQSPTKHPTENPQCKLAVKMEDDLTQEPTNTISTNPRSLLKSTNNSVSSVSSGRVHFIIRPNKPVVVQSRKQDPLHSTQNGGVRRIQSINPRSINVQSLKLDCDSTNQDSLKQIRFIRPTNQQASPTSSNHQRKSPLQYHLACDDDPTTTSGDSSPRSSSNDHDADSQQQQQMTVSLSSPSLYKSLIQVNSSATPGLVRTSKLLTDTSGGSLYQQPQHYSQHQLISSDAPHHQRAGYFDQQADGLTFYTSSASSNGQLPARLLQTGSTDRPTTGMIMLTEEEKTTLIAEGYPIPTRVPLSKQDERNLKRVRRKIKNKISAQESRRKKKEYVETLEKRVNIFSQENVDLKRRVEGLESTNRTLLCQVRLLQQIANNNNGSSNSSTSTNNTSSKGKLTKPSTNGQRPSLINQSTTASSASHHGDRDNKSATSPGTCLAAFALCFFVLLIGGGGPPSVPPTLASSRLSFSPLIMTQPASASSGGAAANLFTQWSNQLSRISYAWPPWLASSCPSDGRSSDPTSTSLDRHSRDKLTGSVLISSASDSHQSNEIANPSPVGKSQSRLIGISDSPDGLESTAWWPSAWKPTSDDQLTCTESSFVLESADHVENDDAWWTVETTEHDDESAVYNHQQAKPWSYSDLVNYPVWVNATLIEC